MSTAQPKRIPHIPEKHYSLAELGVMLFLDKRTLRAAIESGELRPVRRIAGKDLVPVSAVNTWLEQSTTHA